MKRSEELPALTESQLQVMHVVWDKGEATLAEVWGSLTEQKPLAKTTVQTVLTRLVEKGWLTYRPDGNAFAYRATRPRDDTHKQILRRVIDVAFQGSTEGLLLSLFDDKGLSAEEADRLRALIDKAEGR